MTDHADSCKPPETCLGLCQPARQRRHQPHSGIKKIEHQDRNQSNFSRLERWKGHALPGQTKGLYPFGCLAFKHVPAALRSKLDSHATPMVYLGIEPKSCSYQLGSLVFPFRRFQHQEAPASLLWGTDRTII